MTGKWPWVGDSPVDRARRVARSYREALMAHFPEVALELDGKFVEWGEVWVAPQLDTDPDFDEFVTVDKASEYVGQSTKAVYAWIYRKNIAETDIHKGKDGRLRVRLGAVLEQAQELRRKRAAQHPQRHAGAA